MIHKSQTYGTDYDKNYSIVIKLNKIEGVGFFGDVLGMTILQSGRGFCYSIYLDFDAKCVENNIEEFDLNF